MRCRLRGPVGNNVSKGGVHAGLVPRFPTPSGMWHGCFERRMEAMEKRTGYSAPTEPSNQHNPGTAAARSCITETSRIRLVLFDMQNRTFGTYSAALHRILIIETNRIHSVRFGMQNRTLGPYSAGLHRILPRVTMGNGHQPVDCCAL
jgi:hypothetical protein